MYRYDHLIGWNRAAIKCTPEYITVHRQRCLLLLTAREHKGKVSGGAGGAAIHRSLSAPERNEAREMNMPQRRETSPCHNAATRRPAAINSKYGACVLSEKNHRSQHSSWHIDNKHPTPTPSFCFGNPFGFPAHRVGGSSLSGLPDKP